MLSIRLQIPLTHTQPHWSTALRRTNYQQWLRNHMYHHPHRSKKNAKLNSMLNVISCRQMVCDYLKICKDLEMEVNHSIQCNNLTVMRWWCPRENHIMLLCDNHALWFNNYCPYHEDVRMLFSMLDGPIPQFHWPTLHHLFYTLALVLFCQLLQKKIFLTTAHSWEGIA